MAKGASKRRRAIRILIVDDHPVVRQGLAQVIDAEADLEVCGEAEDVASGLKAIEADRPDLVIVDLSLKQSSGLDLIKEVKRRHPDLRMLALSMHDEGIYAERALRAGALGYIMKQEATEQLLSALRRVHAGEIYLSESMARRILHKLVKGPGAADSDSPSELLTDRELQVFQAIGMGRGTRQIAEDLGVSPKTVEAHRAKIKEKLGVATAPALVRVAVRWVESQR